MEPMIKIYLDDIRPAPPGWIRAYWPEEVIAHLESGNVETISLDHDLGDDQRGTGYDVLIWIEEKVVLEDYRPPEIVIHSDNGPARQRMILAVKAILQRLNSKHPDNPLPWQSKYYVY